MSFGHIAIIGGGYSGTMQAINLLRHSKARVTLIERGPRVARGAAYSTPYADHLLNVRAGRMSAFADAPAHFSDWLSKRGGGDADSFAQRRIYGDYLQEILTEAASRAGERLTLIKGDASSVTRADGCEQVDLSDGRRVLADAVIFSVGNLPPETPRAFHGDLGDLYVADPWSGDIAASLRSDDEVLLVGTGLTAIDAALMLDSAGFKGRITAISRRGLVPRAHAASHEVPELDVPPATECASLTRMVRGNARAIGWHAAIDQLRPHTQPLWASASAEQRGRFLRHLRPYWDVHRHRIAPEIADRLDSMRSDGRLRFMAGKILWASKEADYATVVWRPRGEVGESRIAVARIVNCTGPRGNIARSGELLLEQLFKAGRIRPDPCRIGIDIDSRCRVIGLGGRPSETLYAIGPMTRGALWEIVAVPDLRIQTDRLARQMQDAP